MPVVNHSPRSVWSMVSPTSQTGVAGRWRNVTWGWDRAGVSRSRRAATVSWVSRSRRSMRSRWRARISERASASPVLNRALM